MTMPCPPGTASEALKRLDGSNERPAWWQPLVFGFTFLSAGPPAAAVCARPAEVVQAARRAPGLR
jgi:hypothetical protein